MLLGFYKPRSVPHLAGSREEQTKCPRGLSILVSSSPWCRALLLWRDVRCSGRNVICSTNCKRFLGAHPITQTVENTKRAKVSGMSVCLESSTIWRARHWLLSRESCWQFISYCNLENIDENLNFELGNIIAVLQ